MKTTKIYITLLLLGFSLCSIAQGDNNNEGHNGHHVGITAGFTTGVGLSYRYWPGKFGIQATFLPVYYKNTNTQTNANFLSLGLTSIYSISEKPKSTLFVYASGHYLNNTFTGTSGLTGSVVPDTTFQLKRVNIGTGIGLDTKLLGNESLRFNLMVGLGGYNLFSSNKAIKDLGLLPTIESSIYYRF